jgi:pimeloyl-ACP methyl ester carboxylesterase
MRRILKWAVLGVIAIVALAAIAGATWEQVERRAVARRFPVQGTLVDIGGRKIHLDCRGAGSPTVVLIHGLDTGGALSWSAVHDSIALTTRTCAYSRAGIMWSDPAPSYTPVGIADDLHAALNAAGERGPFVLVGHSLGGPIELIYTKRFGDQVAGLVMVDASHPDQVARFREIGISAKMWAVKAIEVAASFSWTGVVRAYSNGVKPMTNESPALAQVRGAWTPRSIAAAISELEALDAILAEASTARALGDRPLVVLTAMKPMTAAQRKTAGFTEAQAAQQKKVWYAMHQDEASWSTAGRQVVVDDATHYIQFDRPDVVIAAVGDVVKAVRGGAAR